MCRRWRRGNGWERSDRGKETPRSVALLGDDGDGAGRAVDSDGELIEEITPEETVALGEIDVVGRHAKGTRARGPHLDALHGNEEHVGGAGGAFDRAAERLGRADAHAREHARVDHRDRRARVEYEIRRPRAVDLGRHHDGLARREGYLRGGGGRRALTRNGARRRRGCALWKSHHLRLGSEAVGHAVQALRVVDPALLVSPAEHLSEGGRSRHHDRRQDAEDRQADRESLHYEDYSGHPVSQRRGRTRAGALPTLR